MQQTDEERRMWKTQNSIELTLNCETQMEPSLSLPKGIPEFDGGIGETRRMDWWKKANEIFSAMVTDTKITMVLCVQISMFLFPFLQVVQRTYK
ncbi:unnamed protein product [Cylicocyclus nassatus]|uniref:Uncharacterized protein n=1 Tax=Cylicocyclus nassatus TaxID=53992 RepID=A0AA36HEC2_CYLNA|nr:unnamed protein product [Cylicocyclus nassatus]